MNKKIVVCVDGIYTKNSKILLLKRNVEPFKGFWHVAGGHVNENESLKDALKREYKEETNLDVKVGKIIRWRVEETADRTKIIFAFKIPSAKGKITLNPENSTCDWFNSTPPNTVYDYTKHPKNTKNTPPKPLPQTTNTAKLHPKNTKNNPNATTNPTTTSPSNKPQNRSKSQ